LDSFVFKLKTKELLTMTNDIMYLQSFGHVSSKVQFIQDALNIIRQLL